MVSTSHTDSNLEIRKPTVNIISGQISSLIYQNNGNNLVEVKISSDNFGEIFVLTAYCNADLNYKTIKIANLHEFQFRLQEAFNHQFVVKVFQESNQIVSIEITRFRPAFPPNIYKSVAPPAPRAESPWW